MSFNLLDVECENKDNLKLAFTHPSYSKENSLSRLKSYERLEFLGDAVLKLAISDLLYKKYPEYEEGELSKIRSILVSDATLSLIAKDINLQDKMILGAGEEHTGGRDRESNIACTMEAVFGAYFLDGKYKDVERFLKENLLPKADDIESHFEKYNTQNQRNDFGNIIAAKISPFIFADCRFKINNPVIAIQTY